jgi:hypothetical protein
VVIRLHVIHDTLLRGSVFGRLVRHVDNRFENAGCGFVSGVANAELAKRVDSLFKVRQSLPQRVSRDVLLLGFWAWR